MSNRNAFRVACALLAIPAILHAAAPAAAQAPDQILDEVVVSGEQPGPAMWKVSRDGHTMWIMGTLSPVPARMSWHSRQAEAIIGQAGEILGDPQLRGRVDIGLFGALRLIPAALRARDNPDGATLHEALPPAVWQRWNAAYRRFFGRDADMKDKSRPLFAADRLYDQALEKSALTPSSPVWPTVQKLARQHKVRIREREFDVPLRDPRGLIEALAHIPREREVACLVATLDYIDQELPNIRRRATAWATGDLATLRALPAVVDRRSCLDALVEALRARLGEQITQVRSQIDDDRAGIFSWMLLTYDTSFTVMPIERLLREDDLVARWRAAGYTVEEPR